MGLLEQVIGGLLSGGGGSQGFQNVLGGLLGGGQGQQGGGFAQGGQGQAPGGLGGMLGGLLGGGQGGAQGGGGLGGALAGGGLGAGLGGLISALQNAGLGQVAQSWVGSGPNQPISPDQLRDVFGQERVNEMANQAGMDTGGFLNQLSQHLPNVVDGLTPSGKLPDEGTVSV